MRLATTTADLCHYIEGCKKDLDATRKMLDYFLLTGFKYLDYNFYDALSPDSLLMQDDWRANMQKIRAYAEQLGLKFVQAHSAGGNPFVHDDKYPILLDSTIRSIEACAILGIENIVVHPGFLPELNEKEFFARNLTFYRQLFPFMEKFAVSVLIENSATANLPANCHFFDCGQKMRAFLDFADHPLLAACWDTGHGNMMPYGQYDSLCDLGDKLKAVHIADNLGVQDNHFAPYFGSLNLDEVISALLDIKYPGYFTFECTKMLIQGNSWPVRRKKWEKDCRLYKVPLELKLEAERLLYKIGVYLLQKYNCLEV